MDDFRIHKDKPIPEDEIKVVGVGLDGLAIAVDNSECLAKMILGQQEQYYVKMQSDGRFFDKSDGAVALHSRNKLTKRMLYEFKKVKKSAFQLYVRYLQEDRPQLLAAAQRENR